MSVLLLEPDEVPYYVSIFISTFFISAFLATALYMLWISHRNNVNAAEFVTIRVMLSLLAGWVTAATILNISIVLKDAGMTGEKTWGWIILIVAFVIYSAFVLIERNFLYGAVFVWVLYWQNNWSDTQYLLYAYTVALLGYTGLIVANKINGNCDRGLLY